MKRYLLNIGGLVALAFIVSCGGDDPLPLPVIDFSLSTELEVLEVGNPITFSNSTVNASSYMWDFGDGSTSTEVNPEHTYEEAGNFTVTLTAFTDDEQSDSLAMDIEILQRVLTRLEIVSIDFSPAYDPSSGPDVRWVFGPEEDEDFEQTIGSVVVPDLTAETFGPGLAFPTTSQEIILTNENWVFVLLDDETDVDPNASAEIMASAQLNPVTDDTSFDEENDEYFIRRSGSGFDFFFIFEIR